MNYNINKNFNFYLNLNKILSLKGWVKNIRCHKNYIFLDLLYFNYIFQILFKNNYHINFLRTGCFIEIYGIILLRNLKDYFSPNGLIEIFCFYLKILNFYISFIFKNLKFYFLNNLFINIFLIKNYMLKIFNLFFYFEKFIYIETPIINKYLTEGSHVYILPCIVKKNFFSLAQSPQIFKQLLMIFGLNKYYQIAKCFRNENSKSNRLNEFIQLDFEFSFYKNLDIIFFIKNFFFFIIYKVFFLRNFYNFSFLFYNNCLNIFFNDKPDLRFKFYFLNLKIFNFYLFNLNKIINLEFYSYFLCYTDNFKNYIFFINKNNFFFVYVFFNFYYFNFLYYFKLINIIFFEIFSLLKILKIFIFFVSYLFYFKISFNYINFFKNNFLNYNFLFLFVINFPIFKYNFNFKKYFFSSNPFSKPIHFDILYLDTNPIICSSKSYDIILNGQEIGGGSVRNNFFFIQKKLFLISYNYFELFYNFNFFLYFLRKSAPDHSGAAIGIDRILTCFFGLDNIRNISIFYDLESKYYIFKNYNFLL
ncbi:hypothetical protein NDNC_0380 [Candidatus Nasuia deltocephalinicola]|nr:hypothetical protein NDNC_0380 [Candidatus Nasuia deltocephalinicola]